MFYIRISQAYTMDQPVNYEMHKRSFKGGAGETVWYISHGTTRLETPAKIDIHQSLHAGDIYIHETQGHGPPDRPSVENDVWILVPSEVPGLLAWKWVSEKIRRKVRIVHPAATPKRYLDFRASDGAPTWLVNPPAGSVADN
jgi:hypothetical protein